VSEEEWQDWLDQVLRVLVLLQEVVAWCILVALFALPVVLLAYALHRLQSGVEPDVEAA